MKNIIKTRIFLAIFAIAFLLTVYHSEASPPIPGISIVVKRNPGGKIIQPTSNDGKGSFTFENCPKGTYDIILVAPAASFEAAKAKRIGISAEFSGVPYGFVSTGNPILNPRVDIKPSELNGTIKNNLNGKQVLGKVLFKDVKLGDTVGALTVKVTFGINEPGVK